MTLPRPARFTIRAASALTGINPNTLRAWERRHGLVRPERTPKGYRLYTGEDIERLRAICRAMQQGISVGRVREHLEDAEGPLGAELEPSAPRLSGGPSATRVIEVSLANAGLAGTASIRVPVQGGAATATQTLHDLSVQIEQAALRFDRAAIERAFGRAVGLYSLRQAFALTLAPALRRVGERYLEGLGNVAEEHVLAAFARERLIAALAGLRPLHQPPRVLCACVPGEQHEIMLMVLALEVGLEGVSTLYLGADTPIEAIAHTVENSGTQVVALSATLALPQEPILTLQQLVADRRRKPTLMIGGPAAARNRDWLLANGIEPLAEDPLEAGRQVVARVMRD
ncbi:MAG: hypothetical protein A2W00_03335 [Candidatus Eisenbacteria bacterium RBG_16_71_46]|nr:MAG: hypothetical protein A2W00_03335 [Candidatus Eisenbacteria bacterium RBG_16_71_46]